MLCAETTGADIKPFGLAINKQSSRVDIGHPAAIGVVLRMADIIAELWSFAA